MLNMRQSSTGPFRNSVGIRLSNELTDELVLFDEDFRNELADIKC